MNSHKRNHSPNDHGFTLIELLVVVVIIGILGSIAAPGWLAFLNRQRVTAVKSDLLSAIKEAQADAKQQSTRRTIEFRNVATGPVVDIKNGSGNVIKSEPLGSNSQLVQITGSSTRLTFDYRGGIDTTVTPAQTVPFTISVASTNTSVTKCVIVTTLLGGLAEGTGSECTNPNASP